MTITLAVLASLLILLPGLTFLGFWNLKAFASGASRPELPLSSATTLLVAVGVSLAAHIVGYSWVELIRSFLLSAGELLPTKGDLWPPLEALVRPDGHLRTIPANPIVAMTAVADGSHLRFEDLMLFGGLVGWESLLVARFVASEGFDVMLDGVDVAGQGWVYQHYVRPARYGYKPIGYALTTMQQNGYGIGYIGAIEDIRMSEKGELLSVALLNPERFLFDLKAKALPRRAGTSSGRPSFRTYGRERLGGVVALDGSSVANILVRTIDKAVFDDIRRLEQEDRA